MSKDSFGGGLSFEKNSDKVQCMFSNTPKEKVLMPKAFHQFGFSLVELVIVMRIVGILLAGLTMSINVRRNLCH